MPLSRVARVTLASGGCAGSKATVVKKKRKRTIRLWEPFIACYFKGKAASLRFIESRLDRSSRIADQISNNVTFFCFSPYLPKVIAGACHCLEFLNCVCPKARNYTIDRCNQRNQWNGVS